MTFPDSVRDVSENVSAVAKSVDKAGRMAGGPLETASELSKQAELMSREVGNFLARVCAASPAR